MRKRTALLTTIAVLLLAIIVVAIVVGRQRVRRHRVFRTEPAATAPQQIPPVQEWTETFRRLEPGDLDDLLNRIEKAHLDLYQKHELAYLHARARLEDNDTDGAAVKLRPYLGASHPLRDLALYHSAEIAEADGDDDGASGLRQSLIFEAPGSIYREQAIDEEVAWLAEKGDIANLTAFASRLAPSAPTARRREIEALVAEALLRHSQPGEAKAKALALLRGGTTDDASDRAARILDRPELLSGLTTEQLAMLGEAMRNHRHYDRAIAILGKALPATPRRGGKNDPRDELIFAIGRGQYGAEQFAAARATYARGASETSDPEQKATFLLHASRAAQLAGDDRGAEALMTQAIAVPGRFTATTAALTQRLRTRLAQKRDRDAAADLALMRKLAPKDRALVDASLAWAIAMVARGRTAEAVAALNAIPSSQLNPYDRAETSYWRGRALEQDDPRGAFNAYLEVLRSNVPSHFAYLARTRLDSPAMAQKLVAELAARDVEIDRHMGAKNFALARRIATDQLLLSTKDHDRRLRRLASIYRELPAYAAILDLKPSAFPAIPTARPDRRLDLLLSLGLFDEAIDAIPQRWPLRPQSSALTQSLALQRGMASRESIYAIEILMKSVPEDYVPELLPLVIRQLLYPRYFHEAITADAKKHGADSTLVLSIMREESRFNPRAKSAAAARGLLQFIITTARDIGREIGLIDVQPEDLYDPRVIISLGAKYVASLSEELGGDRYRIAAAYNAGPKQAALWSRLAPATGADYFISAINFDETKHYVRKVMNSYQRYSEIYGGGGPQGGLRPEP